MAHDFFIELVAQNNRVLTVSRKVLLFGITRVPDPRFTHEVESRLVNNQCLLPLGLRAEKDRRAENPLE